MRFLFVIIPYQLFFCNIHFLSIRTIDSYPQNRNICTTGEKSNGCVSRFHMCDVTYFVGKIMKGQNGGISFLADR